MPIRWIQYLAVTAVAFSSFGCASAATGMDTSSDAGSRARAASVLFPQFESVGYAATDVLSRFTSSGPNAPKNGADQTLPISLRLPFIQLLIGLHFLGPDALTKLNTNYSGVLVGAKGFKPPEGLGMFSSQDCYIGLLRPGGKSIVEAYLNQSGSQTIDGQKVWTWTAPPYEGYPYTTTYYIADIEHSYFVMGNDLTAFRATMRQLSQGTEDDSKISDPDALSDKAYWAYRSLRWNKVKHDTDTAGPASQMTTVVMKFTADFGTMTGQLEADSTDPDLKNDPKQLPASQIFNYQRKAPGIWLATVPIAADPNSTTALYTVASVFGFGVVL
jgi:hypothetical protein